MRLHRFFSPEKILYTKENRDQNDTSDLITRKSATAQWRKVFRFGPGDRVVLFDGTGVDFVCEILEYKGKNGSLDQSTVLKIIECHENNVKPTCRVSLFVAVVKKDTFEWITEKATELGVSDIVPMVAERSEKKNLNIKRLEKIVIEASEQSGRGYLPRIHSVENFKDVLAEIKEKKQQIMAFDPTGVKFSKENLVIDVNSFEVVVFIGPEGGWSERELSDFKRENVPIFSLGPQILRTETAVVAVLSLLVF